ncbi:fatty acid desaturase [Burkholderia alba]|uniref:fatty acid desaturase n=1 Tax=Burkholderia alba TaxID=2683677 RepID=UPI002B05D186|nr:fatty acid desaturase [Burkholderia alba]
MSANIRESYAVFPKWSQPFWTLFTGKPLADEQPLFVPSCWTYLAISMAVFLGGIAGSFFLLMRAGAPVWLVPFTVGLALYGSRLLILTVAHQCAHLRFCRGKRLNRIVHDVLSTLNCTQDYEGYRHDHFQVHHALKTFGTFQDPVMMFIRQLDFTEARSKPQLWRQLVLLGFSPAFHGRYLFNRWRANLTCERLPRRLAAIVWWLAIGALLVLYPPLRLPIAIGYLLPVFVLYNVSAFLELICEHVWMRPLNTVTPRQRTAELIWGRFCGDAAPVGQGGLRWLRWAARMLFYHLPCRMFVLTGDAPQHDFHHVAPNNPNWAVSAYARRDAIAAGQMEDREIWGLFAAIDIVFSHISAAHEHAARLDYLEVEV